jgi:hypothetical protein
MTSVPTLVRDLTALHELLSAHRVLYAATVAETLNSINADPQSAKKAVLNLYKGSMGSITDIYISRRNGHVVDDEKAANVAYERIVQQLWEEANALP